MKTLLTIITLAATLCPLTAKPFSQETVRSTSNQIDQLVAAHLQKKKIPANPIIDDGTFVRRAYISIAGRIPTDDEARAYIADASPDKRRTLIDTLIHSKGYQSRMFNYWADLLRLKTNHEKSGLGWHVWIRQAVEKNMPYDQFVRAMISSEGLPSDNPAVGYYLRDRGMLLDNISNTAQVFLGTQIGCAQCHDHPFEDITQRQFYEFAAFAGGTEYKSQAANDLLRKITVHTLKEKGVQVGTRDKKKRNKNRNMARQIARDYANLFRDFRRNAVTDNPHKQLKLPHDYQYNDGKPGEVVSPKTYFGEPADTTNPEQRRENFANWITSPENPFFTKVIVNRLWAQVFGRGIVEPLDDWSETTTVSHPELIDYLCKVMKATNYDTREFMRVLYHTRLFESAVASREAAMGGQYDFRGPVLRRMSATELHDSFITLEFGNKDNTTNSLILNQWNNYTQSVKNLFSMPIPQLIALDDAADKAEEQTLALRQSARELRIRIEKAKGEGDIAKAQKLQAQLRQKYQSIKKEQTDIASGNKMIGMVMQRNLRTRPLHYLRSSEKPAPFQPGTLMRQFGSSDRETPEASHTQASIPQVLTLLNGREITRISDGSGQLARKLRSADSAQAKLNTLFLSIYGTHPSSREQQRYLPMMQSPKDIQTLAKAMLNSKRFLFVQ